MLLGTKDVMDCFKAKFKTSSLDNHVTQGSSNVLNPVTRACFLQRAFTSKKPTLSL